MSQNNYLDWTEEQWRAKLSPEEYAVLREAGTERPGIGEYTNTTTEGVYSCRACGAELFRSETKFASHCGWRSFFAPLALYVVIAAIFYFVLFRPQQAQRKQHDAAVRAIKRGDAVVTAGGIELQEGEYEHRLVAADPESTAALPGGAGLVVLDLTVTEELEAEGWAKDRIREIQEARRAAGFDISDRIRVRMAVPADRREWADRHAQLIAAEVLATDFAVVDGLDAAEGDAVELAEGVRMTLARV